MLWSAFLPELLTFASGCPIPVAESKARQAAIEFFGRTRAWVEWLDPILSVAGAMEYDLDLPSGADVARVEQATLGGSEISIVSYRDARHDWAAKDLPDQGLVSRDLKTFRLGQAVAAGLQIQIQVALVPSRNSTGIPDFLFNRYLDDIAHGARAAILSIPGTPFYNPEIFMLERSAFESAIATRSVQAWCGNTAKPPRSRPLFC